MSRGSELKAELLSAHGVFGQIPFTMWYPPAEALNEKMQQAIATVV